MTPERFKHAKYEDVPQLIRDLFDKVYETRRGIYIHGDVGTGKTHISYAMKNQWESTTKPDGQPRRAMFWNTTELLHSIRTDFDRPYGDKEKAEDRILDYAGLLFLDDVGAEKMSEWVAETFYLIINHRYNRVLPTIFTSNLPISDLADRIGDRTVSRIVEMSDVVELVGKDRRITNSKPLKVNL